MSAQFIVTYHGHPVRFTYLAGKMVFEVVGKDRASRFVSEPEAWWAAAQHQMNPMHCEVRAENQVEEVLC